MASTTIFAPVSGDIVIDPPTPPADLAILVTARRYGLSMTRAALTVQHAGLGPREAR